MNAGSSSDESDATGLADCARLQYPSMATPTNFQTRMQRMKRLNLEDAERLYVAAREHC